MKRVILIFASLLFSLFSFSQSQKLLGVTLSGGPDTAGTVFSIDTTGFNHVIHHTFIKTNSINSYAIGELTLGSNGKVYGLSPETKMTPTGKGAIFEYDSLTNQVIDIAEFDTNLGYFPYCGMVDGGNGFLYGTTYSGAVNGSGSIFSFETATNTISKLADFPTNMYSTPDFIKSQNGKFYGFFQRYAPYQEGIFEFDPISNSITVIDTFSTNTGKYSRQLMETSTGIILGVSGAGGSTDLGTVFQLDLVNNLIIKKHDFIGFGSGSSPGWIQELPNGDIYGLCFGGGTNGAGTIFKYDPLTGSVLHKIDLGNFVSDLYPLSGISISNNQMYFIASSSTKINSHYIFTIDTNSSSIAHHLQFTLDHNRPNIPGNMLLTNNQHLLGITFNGVFDFNPTATSMEVRGLFNSDYYGTEPSGVALGSDGMIYGITRFGGTANCGTVFKIDPNTNTFTKLKDLTYTDGIKPTGGFKKAPNGKLYATTTNGGINTFPLTYYSGYGTIISFDPATGKFKKEANFSAQTGGSSHKSELTIDNQGIFWGVSSNGGGGYPDNTGTLFSFNPSTQYITQHHHFLNPADGISPWAAIALDGQGNIFGSTSNGANGQGSFFKFDVNSKNLSKMMDFTTQTTGYRPYTATLMGSNGQIYSSNAEGGANGEGVLYSINPSTNIFTKFHDFSSGNSGSYPAFNIIQSSYSNNLFGTTSTGGTGNFGTIYKFDINTNSLTSLFSFSGLDGAIPKICEAYMDTLINSIAEINTNNIIAFPNPFTDQLVIETINNTGSFTLINIQGVEVISGRIEGVTTTIKTDHLKSGMYILIITEDGNQRMKKVMRQ